MSRSLLIICVIFSAIPNFNVVKGLPVLDVLVLIFILIHAIHSRDIFKELLLFLCLLLASFLYRYSFNELDLLEYGNYVLRYVLFYGLLLIPSQFYNISRDNKIWTFLSVVLLANVSIGISNTILRGFSRREMEYFYFNDVNMLFFTLFFTLIISQKKHIVLIVLALLFSVLSGARLASLIGLYVLFSKIGKGTSALILLAFSLFMFVPNDLFNNLLLFERLSSGLTNDEYSRGSLWLVYVSSMFEACSWCYIYKEFSSIGLHVMRPAHNFFLSTLAINGLLAGTVVILRTVLRLRDVISLKHFWVVLILLFFDIQFSRGLILLLIIYDSSRNEKAGSFNPSIQ